MNEPYANNPANSGVLYYSDDQVAEFCRQANRLGLQIEMHAIGDRAFDQACRALKAALYDCPRADHRHGIIHACIPTEEGMEICEKYRIQLPMLILDEATSSIDTRTELKVQEAFARLMLEILNRIVDNKGTLEDLDLLEELSDTITSTALCGLGKSACKPVQSTMRTGMEAVYTLLNVDRGVPEVWGSTYDIRDLLNATVQLRDGRTISDLDLGFKARLVLKEGLKRLEGTDVEKLLKEHHLI